MKFPKDRDGFSPQGNKDARTLDALGVPFLQRRRPGFVARKKNGFLEVRKTDKQGLSAFYSTGVVGGINRIRGSRTARGTFIAVNDAPEAGTDTASRIHYYGRPTWLGSYVTFEDIGFADNWDGQSCRGYQITVFRMRRDGTMAAYYQVIATTPPIAATDGVSPGIVDVITIPGGVSGPSGARVFEAGLGITALDEDLRPRFFYVHDDGAEPTLRSGPPIVEDQLAASFIPFRLAPGVLLGWGRYVRPSGYASGIVSADCPGLTFHFSNDNGQSWTPASSTALFQEFFDDFVIPGSNANQFNRAVAQAGLNIAPLSRRFSVAMALVPYDTGILFGTNGIVRLGIIDNAAMTLLATETLFDGELAAALAYWSGGIVGVRGGAVIHTKPIHPDGVASTILSPPVFRFTPDGVSSVVTGTGPAQNNRTGYVSALSPDKVALPMFDGAYSLYDSTDRGATWGRRATIDAELAAPADTPGRYWLRDFAHLSFLQKGDQPANALPGTPWATDSRVEAPIL